MNKKQNVLIAGIIYTIRYSYTRPDGTVWNVLDVAGGFQGEFGDEVPA